MKARYVGTVLAEPMTDSHARAVLAIYQSGIIPENIASLRLRRSAGFREISARERFAQHRGRSRHVMLLERRSPTI